MKNYCSFNGGKLLTVLKFIRGTNNKKRGGFHIYFNYRYKSVVKL